MQEHISLSLRKDQLLFCHWSSLGLLQSFGLTTATSIHVDNVLVMKRSITCSLQEAERGWGWGVKERFENPKTTCTLKCSMSLKLSHEVLRCSAGEAGGDGRGDVPAVGTAGRGRARRAGESDRAARSAPAQSRQFSCRRRSSPPRRRHRRTHHDAPVTTNRHALQEPCKWDEGGGGRGAAGKKRNVNHVECERTLPDRASD